MSNIQTKQTPFVHIKSMDNGRARTGIASVFGNIDEGDDRIWAGAYSRTIGDGKIRHKHLWGHNWGQPPTAAITELREVGRNELPQEVLDLAPDATGGLLVTREYFKSDLCDLILQGIDAGAMEMSIGYDPVKFEYTDIDGKKVRELKEVRLLETSDVPFGMNAATTAAFAKAMSDHVPPVAVLLHQIEMGLHNIKAGARNSAQDMAHIAQIHALCVDLGFDKCIMANETAEKSASNPTGEEPAPALNSTALLNQAKVNDLRLSELRRRSDVFKICTSS